VSQLTSDIVWLESQTVSLPDGSVQTVLVPKVYLAHVADGSVKSSGALVTGDSVVINVDNLANRGGTINGSNGGKNGSGTGRTVLVATNDLVNQSGTIKGNDVVLQAGRDLINQTLTATQSYKNTANNGTYTATANQAM
jgi:filamentous hemagglutinin